MMHSCKTKHGNYVIHLKIEVLKSRWVFKIKQGHKDGSPRYRARMVIKGYEQIPGIDYHETYSPVVRFNTLRCLFAVAVKYDYDIDHLDVVTAFLNGDLEEDIWNNPKSSLNEDLKGKSAS